MTGIFVTKFLYQLFPTEIVVNKNIQQIIRQSIFLFHYVRMSQKVHASYNYSGPDIRGKILRGGLPFFIASQHLPQMCLIFTSPCIKVFLKHAIPLSTS